MRKPILSFLVLLTCFLSISAAQASTWYVATTGSDTTGNGSSGSPWATIQKAVDMSASGDTINVAAGRYSKPNGSTRALVTIDGKDNLTIVGAAGAILDISDHTIAAGTTWTDDGNGVYRLTKSGMGKFLAITVDNGSGPKLLVTGDGDAYSGATYSSINKWYWRDHIKYGVHNADHTYELEYDNWVTLRGAAIHNATYTNYAWTTDDQTGILYIKLTNGAAGALSTALNPNGYTVKCSRAAGAGLDYCGILLKGAADNNTIRGFEFQNGYKDILLEDAYGTIIENCVFKAFKCGIWGVGAGVENTTVRYCEFTVNPFSAHVGKDWALAEQVWATQKEWGPQDWWTMWFSNTAGGHHVHDNYIHESWDGLSMGWQQVSASDWKNSEVDHNLIINCLDDALDIMLNCDNTRVHDNIMINNQNNVRVRSVVTTGSNYFAFYNNILLAGPMSDNGVHMPDGSGTGTAYFYQNTIEGNNRGTDHNGIFTNQSQTDYDYWFWANNLFQGHRWLKNQPDTNLTWRADYNVYCLRPGETWSGSLGQIDTSFDPDRNIDTSNSTLWSNNDPDWTTYNPPASCPQNYATYYNVSLTSTSVARSRGANLTTLFGFTPPGTIGTDCGALQYGASMPAVPRTGGTSPTLSSINPNNGPTAGGTACTLTGTNLTGCSTVSFGGTAGTGIVVDSTTQVRCTSPARSAGSVSVTATTPNGTSNGVTFTYNAAAPTLTSINPTSGSAAGGTACTLTGTNLTGCSAVSFGGTAGTGMVVDSTTQVRCTSPAKAAGTYAVTATTPGGTSNGVNFTYTPDGGGTTTTLNPTKDTYIYSYAPTTQYGTVAYVRTWDSATNRRQTYMAFSLAGLTGTVTSAKLRLYCSYTDDAGVTHPLNVYSYDTDSWTENMTWTSSGNGPYGTQLVTTSSAHTVNTWYEFSSAALTSYVNTQMAGDDVVTLVLLYDEGNYQKDDQWASRESANDPQLVVVTQ